MRIKFALSCAAIAAAAAGPAFAQDEGADDGLYLRVGVGASFAKDWSQDFTYNPDVVFVDTPPTGQTIENGRGKTFGAAIGFDYADGIRTELEYRYAATNIDAVTLDDPVNGPTPASTVNDEMHAQFVMANFYFDLLNNGPLTPYVGGGVGGARVANENEQHDVALAYQARAGVSYALASRTSVDFDVSYLRTNKFAFGPNDDEFAPGGPIFRADGARYAATTVMIGLRQQF
ncbi:MAG: outer membrane beta-barrel protein [Parvularculaceae bacterium]